MEEEKHLAYLFDSNKVKPIDYVRNNTDYLSKFKEEDIKDIKADYHNKLYILLNNGLLYWDNGDVIENVDYIYQMDYVELFAVTYDKRIICLNNKVFQEYFGDIKYDSIITYLFGIVALYNGEVKITLDFEASASIDYHNFIGVSEIGVDDNNDEVYVKKNGKWIKLFKK